MGTTEEKKDINYDENGFEPKTQIQESDNLPQHYRLAHGTGKITMVINLNQVTLTIECGMKIKIQRESVKIQDDTRSSIYLFPSYFRRETAEI